MVVQGTILMHIMPTNDFRIKLILQDEWLDSLLKTTYFCDRMPANLTGIKQTEIL